MRIDEAFPSLRVSLRKRDALHDRRGHYEWTRENGEQVVVVVSSDGAVTTTINGVAQPPLNGFDFETACDAVEMTMNAETVR
jgi:hypothetical protein